MTGGPAAGLVIAALALGWVAVRGSRSHFVCPKCGAAFKAGIATFMLTPHMMGKRLVRCPNCNNTEYMAPVSDSE